MQILLTYLHTFLRALVGTIVERSNQFSLVSISSCIANVRRNLRLVTLGTPWIKNCCNKIIYYNVQIQKISILPPLKGLEFPGGGGSV